MLLSTNALNPDSGGVRSYRLWSSNQLLRSSGQQCNLSSEVCQQIQGYQRGAYVDAVEEMICVVCVCYKGSMVVTHVI